MKILVHDYSGHPPQIRVSRELSRLGHEVLYLYAKMNQTPNGNLTEEKSQQGSFHITGIESKTAFQKHHYFRRQFQEILYSKPLLKAVREFGPDLAVCSDTPLFPLNTLRGYCASAHIPFVLWMMDIRSFSIRNWISKRLPILGSLIGTGFVKFEEYIARRSDYIISISDDFCKTLAQWRIPPDQHDVLPLWAPLDEIPVRPKDNVWSRRYRLSHTTNIIYAGTLGLSHSASHFVEMAKHFARRSNVRIVVITEGPNASYLMNEKNVHHLENLIILKYQPYHVLPDVFGSADVLLAVLNDEAAAHSAPGKVLSHLCAGKPQFAIMPRRNSMARVILESDSGIIVDPVDVDGILSTLERLVDAPETRMKMGRKARMYAERKFDIERIGKDFEALVTQPFAGGGSNGRGRALQT